MKIFFYAAAGLLTGAAFFSTACFCAQPSAPDGEYGVSPYDKDTRERDISIEVDVPSVRETFTRDGRKYEIEYRALSETEYGISGMTPQSTKTFDGK